VHIIDACNRAERHSIRLALRVALQAILTKSCGQIRKYFGLKSQNFSFEGVADDALVTLDAEAESRVSAFRQRNAALTPAEYLQCVAALPAEKIADKRSAKLKAAEQATFTALRAGTISKEAAIATLRKIGSQHYRPIS
jgi:hypothetical protein